MKKEQQIETEVKNEDSLPSAIIGLAQERAEEESLNIMLENKDLQKVVRAYFVSGYVKGALGVIKDEIHDRIAEKVTGSRKAQHKQQIENLKARVAEPGTKKPKLKKA